MRLSTWCTALRCLILGNLRGITATILLSIGSTTNNSFSSLTKSYCFKLGSSLISGAGIASSLSFVGTLVSNLRLKVLGSFGRCAQLLARPEFCDLLMLSCNGGLALAVVVSSFG